MTNTIIDTEAQVNDKPDSRSVWRTDLDRVPATRRRTACMAIRMTLAHPGVEERLDEPDFTMSLWEICLPLFQKSSIRARVLERTVNLWEFEGKEVDAGVKRRMALFADGIINFKFKSSAMTRRLNIGFNVNDVIGGEIRDILWSLSKDDVDALDANNGNGPTHPSLVLLVRAAGLDPVEAALLDMSEKQLAVPAFKRFLRECSRSDEPLEPLLVAALGFELRDIARALGKRGNLARLALMPGSVAQHDLEDSLEPKETLRMVVLSAPSTFDELLELFVEPHVAGAWSLDAFPHLATDAERARGVLTQAARTAAPGVNVLLYGPPGTGKTEFAYSLAAAADLKAYRVRTEDQDGDPLHRNGRWSSYTVLQRLLRNHRGCVLVFDEVEDVFSNPSNILTALLGDGDAAVTGSHKGWTNRTLEDNPVPAIWITNRTDGMDSAFLRRFLLPVAIGTPPLQVRREMVQAHLSDARLPEALREELAADDKLQPAQFGMAKRLLSLLPDGDPETVVRQGIASSRRLLHGSGMPRARGSSTAFDVEFLNVMGGIAPIRIADCLRRTGQGRLCFFGPPGTGKTEFAHVLAAALGRELVARTGADLLSRWVGGTEQNIARLFESTDPEYCILLLDEVDSLLRSRSLAERSWETSQVNEMLQRMESYPGILIAATNLAEHLDAAALRRFDFKLQFRPLTPEQRVRLFAREALGGADLAHSLPPGVSERLAHMHGLTAGDFANVARQVQLLGEKLMPEDYLKRLMFELRCKKVGVVP